MVTAVGGPKGGPGKSTLAINIACSYAQMGHTVMLIDADETNKHCIRWVENRPPDLHRRLDVCQVTTPEALVASVRSLADKYDHLVIDAPPILKKMTAKIALLADYMIIPFYPGTFDLYSFEDFLHFFSDATDVRATPLPAAVVFNKEKAVNTRTADLRAAVSGLIEQREQTDIRLLDRGLVDRNAYSDCQKVGLSIVQYSVVERDGRAAATEWNKVFDRLIDDINERIFKEKGLDPSYYLNFDDYMKARGEGKEYLKKYFDDLKALQLQ